MGGRPNLPAGRQETSDEYLAPRILKEALKFLGGLLIAVGKPFFFLVIYLSLAAIFLLYVIGYFFRVTFFRILKKFKNLITAFFLKYRDFPQDFYQKNKESVKAFLSSASAKLKYLFLRTSIFFIPKPITPKASFKPSSFKLRFFLLSILFLFTTVSAFIFIFWFLIVKDLPDPRNLVDENPQVSTKIYDRNGILLYTIYKDQNRSPVTLSEIPTSVKLATIAIEDAEFYSHPGFSIKGIVRATFRNIKRGQLSGGSTITQQLVKNSLLSPEKTFTRKLREIVLAVQVELVFSKDEILEMYLNNVSYGGTAYGIKEAAKYYFDKNLDKLTLAESALLAGLPKSPTLNSPFGGSPERAIVRQKEVLSLMQINKFITEKQKQEAEDESLVFTKKEIPIKAPHFVFYIREFLENKYGKEVVEKGGLEVITTLDFQIQELAQQVVKEEVEKLAKLNVGNGAAVVINPKTGEILAMVGSKDYFDEVIDGNVNMTLRPRQPGSSIKVVNYAYALSNGFTPATIILDAPITFFVQGQPPYSPKNYEGGFRGNVTLRSAFAESRNIPAVRVLNEIGVANMIEMGRKMGITSWDDTNRFGLSLTLGGGEVKLLDLARTYATVANYGKRPEMTSITQVKDYKGKVLEREPFDFAQGKQVLDPRVAFIITDILKDNVARSPSFGTNSLLVIPKHTEVAVKTGTSNDLRDNLAIGFNQNYLVAVWVGNNDNSEMARIASGVTGATPIWNRIISSLLVSEPNHDWEIPQGLVKLPICPYTGTLACVGCPIKMEWFLEENKPQKACSPDWFKKAEENVEVFENDDQSISPTPQPQLVFHDQSAIAAKDQF